MSCCNKINLNFIWRHWPHALSLCGLGRLIYFVKTNLRTEGFTSDMNIINKMIGIYLSDYLLTIKSETTKDPKPTS